MSDERPEDVATDTADEDTVSMQALGPAPADPSPARSITVLPAALALAAILVALVCSGLLYWQARGLSAALADTQQEARAAFERSQGVARAAEQNAERLAEDIARNAQSVRGLGDRLESIPGRFADVERRIDAIAGGSFGARNEWLVAEAAYYLGVANSELQLGQRWNNALAALRLADERLREVGDPGLAGVREQIAEEILALESVRLVDIEGLAHSLSRLAARVGELPLRAAAADGGAQSEDGAQEEPGLGRLWSSIENAFSGIVRVERRDDSALAVLTAQEQRLIARQLSVELQTARLALVSGEAGMFGASLEHAAALLRMDFDSNDPAVEGGLRLVESLLELDVAPPVPDISRSLAMLRARGEP